MNATRLLTLPRSQRALGRSLLLLALPGLIVLLSLALSSGDTRAGATPQAVCSPWVQVNDGAFGMPSNFDRDGNPIEPPPPQPYAAEEGFEVLVFNGQLYVGMEADNTFGARLWRTRAGVVTPSSQADWEEVIADADGNPFGIPDPAQNDHIDSLALFNGYLYASTANRSGSTLGTRVFRSPSGDPGSWEDVVVVQGPGFGDLNNGNFKDMQVFQGWLCGGTHNQVTGAQVWCTTEGTTWLQKNVSGFGTSANSAIWSGYVYNGALYFGVQSAGDDLDSSADDVARLFRTADLDGTPTWAEVYTGPPGSYRVDILGDLNGYLYIATRSSDGIVILRSPTGDPGTWVQVNIPGMDGSRHNFSAVVDSGAVYHGALYVGVANTVTGVEVWRTTGLVQGDGPVVDWVRVAGHGLGDANNLYTELIPFNGYLYAWTSNYVTGQQVLRARCPAAKYVILMIADGWGANHIAAAQMYSGQAPPYQGWPRYWMTTYAAGGNYDPARAWTDFEYVTGGTTDSAAAATAMYAGVKTANGRISVSADGAERLFTIADKARRLGKGVGAVTSVYISHATPGAWYAHNDSRRNGYAIADEGFWGDPNTTGTPIDDSRYGGGHGPTLPPADVMIGAGHPAWSGGGYVNQAMRDRLAAESGQPGAFTFVERVAGSPDGGARLLGAAGAPTVTRLAGLFGGTGGNLDWRLADGSGYNPENPTLAEMALAALDVLARNPDGFVLMVEGGAVDWAGHANNMDRMLGEMLDFNSAVEAVIDWVEDPTNGSSWENTLVIVTGDHETGYLTAGPGVFPDQPLGEVSPRTLALEKSIAGSSRRASWEDLDGDSVIDPGEPVYWAWNSGGHTNMLIPLYAQGAGSEFFAVYATASDPVRGPFLDNTDVFKVMDAVTLNPLPRCPDFVPPPGVDLADAQATADHWRQQAGDPGWEQRFDLNQDGTVTLVDVLLVVARLGRSCP